MTTRRPKKRVRSRTLHHGFTLIELAVAMFVIKYKKVSLISFFM